MEVSPILAIVLLALCCLMMFSIFTVHEGYIGVCYVLGSLQDTTYGAGIHWNQYWILGRIAHVNVRPQTDQITLVGCGTSDGLALVFENVDVGNTLPPQHVIETIRKYGEDYDTYLIKDKIRHQMQVICAGMTSHEVFNTRFHEIDDLLQNFLIMTNQELKSGLDIDFVRLSKPIIPNGIRQNYEKLAEEKAMLKVEVEKQARLQKEAETRHMLQEKDLQLVLHRSQMDLQITAEKAQNENEIKHHRILSDEKNNQVENRMREQKAQTDAAVQSLQASSLKDLYSIDGFKETLFAEHLSKSFGTNTKFFFGQIPNFLHPHFLTNQSIFF